MRDAKPLWAVLRFDVYDGVEHVTVKEVVGTQVEADSEAGRLNALNGSGECRYEARHTRGRLPAQPAG